MYGIYFWNIILKSILPLRSCHSCDTFLLFLELSLKKAQTCNCFIKGLETFWWCSTSFPTWLFSSLFDLQYVHWKLKQTLTTCGQHGAMVCFCFCLLRIYWRWKLHKVRVTEQKLRLGSGHKQTSFDNRFCKSWHS